MSPERLARKREYDRQYRSTPEAKERQRVRNAKYRLRVGRAAIAAYDRARRLLPEVRAREKAREASPEQRHRRRASQLARYGLTTQEWDALFEYQGRCCAACGRTEPGTRAGWHTDHVHGTLLVRGIVCHRCNHGASDDTPEGCFVVGRYREVGPERVATFLEKYRGNK